MTRPNGIHHLAISTADIKEQIRFCTEVLGMELVALYWMHGIEGAWHAFLRMNDYSYLAFVHMPAIKGIEREIGKSHAPHGGGPSAGGTMQHLSLRVDTEEELLAMRDRIRAHGIPVFGPADHGMCKSIYFGGPENMTLEIAVSEMAINPDAWLDPEVVRLAGISEDELEGMRNPRRYERPKTPVPQPDYDPSAYRLGYPEQAYQKMLKVPDDKMIERMSYPDPPVKL